MALRVANSVWKNELLDAHFTEEYMEGVSKNYAAEYRTFLPENVVEKVNQWASAKTEKLIEKLLPENYDASDLAVILMNALYYKNSWLESFQKDATDTGEFTTKDGGKTEKEFMHRTDSFLYYEDEETQLLVLPMKGGVNMVFVLGDRSGLAEKISKASYQRVQLTIPKFDIETSFDQGEFVDFLKESGVTAAFESARADFSRMIDCPVYVGDIIQKTRIKIDEDGVEAAAVTAILMLRGAYLAEKPIEFKADRPFYFSIYAAPGEQMLTLFAGEIVE
jgi:serpin B